MSRIGKKPVAVPGNFKVAIDGNVLVIDSGKVKKEYDFGSKVKVSFEDNEISLTPVKDDKEGKMFLGLHRSNINNVVKGLSKGFKEVVEYNGVGYRAIVNKGILALGLGYSHDIFYAIPSEVDIAIEKPNLIVVTGDDKTMVGKVAAEIMSFRKIEPYKGKGLKKYGQAVIRKEGKKK